MKVRATETTLQLLQAEIELLALMGLPPERFGIFNLGEFPAITTVHC